MIAETGTVFGGTVVEIPVTDEVFLFACQRNRHRRLNVVSSSCSVPNAHFINVSDEKLIGVDCPDVDRHGSVASGPDRQTC